MILLTLSSIGNFKSLYSLRYMILSATKCLKTFFQTHWPTRSHDVEVSRTQRLLLYSIFAVSMACAVMLLHNPSIEYCTAFSSVLSCSWSPTTPIHPHHSAHLMSNFFISTLACSKTKQSSGNNSGQGLEHCIISVLECILIFISLACRVRM